MNIKLRLFFCLFVIFIKCILFNLFTTTTTNEAHETAKMHRNKKCADFLCCSMIHTIQTEMIGMIGACENSFFILMENYVIIFWWCKKNCNNNNIIWDCVVYLNSIKKIIFFCFVRKFSNENTVIIKSFSSLWFSHFFTPIHVLSWKNCLLLCALFFLSFSFSSSRRLLYLVLFYTRIVIIEKNAICAEIYDVCM